MELNGMTLMRIRKRLGLTQTEFANLIGTSQGRYSKWERDEDSPSGRFALRIMELAPSDEINGVAALGAGDSSVRRIRVVGDLQAGAWREAIEWAPDDQYDIVVTPPPGLEKYDDVQGFIVNGESMNLYYPSGSLVFVEPTISTGKSPQSGKHVLVSRRNREGLYEATLKEYVVNEDGTKWLWPRSRDPEHQAPIRYDDKDAEEVTITGIVRASFAMAP